jgi:tetratricopeptide (TPR) repeat protein
MSNRSATAPAVRPQPAETSAFDADRLVRERLQLEALLVQKQARTRSEDNWVEVSDEGLCGRATFLPSPCGMKVEVVWQPEDPMDSSLLEGRLANLGRIDGVQLNVLQTVDGGQGLQSSMAFADGFELKDLAVWYGAVASAAQRLFAPLSERDPYPFHELSAGLLPREEALANLDPEARCRLAGSEEILADLATAANGKFHVMEAEDVQAGAVVYAFDFSGAMITVQALTAGEHAYDLHVEVLLGRLEREYARAARWLVANRARRAFSVALSAEAMDSRVLGMCFSRTAAPGDPLSVGMHLHGVAVEVASVKVALSVWYPSMVNGSCLHRARRDANFGSVFGQSYLLAMNEPRSVLERAESIDQNSTETACFIASAAKWAGEPDLQVHWLQKAIARRAEAPDEVLISNASNLEFRLAQALKECGRVEEALALGRQLLAASDDEQFAQAVRCFLLSCLVPLQRYEEALEEYSQFDQWDHEAALWATAASAGLGRLEDAMKGLCRWEAYVEEDSAARALVKSLLAAANLPEEGTGPDLLGSD